MKLKSIILALTVGVVSVANAVTITPEHEKRARELVSKMTLDEKISYLSGETSFSLRPIERLGIPRILLADGPQGIRNHCKGSTLYPSGILAAATWNRDLINRYGRSLGDDARARGVSILLGPGVNIYRSPLCGRNYEYMGEDPYLTSEIAANYIDGVQSRGVIATIKHFAANNQEWSRHHVSSDVDERTLNEIYFPAFRKAVKKAGVGAVMDSYNLINGVHATENHWLNTDVLRNQWGFKGLLMSDWTSVYSTVNAANSGLDLEMPKAVHYTDSLLRDALANGRVTMKTIDDKVAHLLQTFIAFGLLDREAKDSSISHDYAPSRETALVTAREGIVLLKNDAKTLPLKGRTVILGPNADTIVSGGGSGTVKAFSITPLSRAMKKARKNTVVLDDSRLYVDVIPMVFTDETKKEHGFKGEYFTNQKMEGTPFSTRTDPRVDFNWKSAAPMAGMPDDHFSARWTGVYTPDKDETLKITIGGDDGYRLFVNNRQVAGDWGNHSFSERQVEFDVKKGETYRLRVEYFDNISDATVRLSMKSLDRETLRKELSRADNVVLCTGFTGDVEGEGFDRNFALPAYQEKFIKDIAAINPNLTVVINAGGAVDLSKWIDDAKAIVMAWYPGQEGGTALAEILTGKISPSGKLPITYDRVLADNPSFKNYHTNRKKTRSTNTRECNHVEYREGVFGGYRGYDREGKTPLYPFGYGLSYSTFEFDGLELSPAGENKVKVTFNIKNTGKQRAAEVAQVYVTDTECSVPRPVKELKGFEKVELAPGETRRVEIILEPEAFSFYDIDSHDFVIEPGEFEISVGNSSATLPLKGKITL